MCSTTPSEFDVLDKASELRRSSGGLDTRVIGKLLSRLDKLACIGLTAMVVRACAFFTDTIMPVSIAWLQKWSFGLDDLRGFFPVPVAASNVTLGQVARAVVHECCRLADT